MGCNACKMNMFYPEQPVQQQGLGNQPYQQQTLGFDWGTFVFGAVVGSIAVMLLATRTGRGILGASGRRVERRISRR